MQLRWIEDLAADLRFALRAFRRSPGFVLTAVISLALGIGANTAIFTALDVAFWKPLPVADPYHLVRFVITRTNRGDRGSLPSEFAPALERSGVFSGTVAYSTDGFSLTYDGRAERVQGEVVSPNYFTFLGLEPFLGQGFTPDVRAGRWAAEAVLSYRFWARRFGGDPRVIGKGVHVNTYPFTIVGVSAPGFHDLQQGYDPDLRMPVMPEGMQMKESDMLSSGVSTGMARLAPGVAMAQAEAATDALFQEFLRTGPPQVRRAGYLHVRVMPGATGSAGELLQFQTPLFVLMALVGTVLLIACANLAGLLLARATARRRELAVRSSIGAGRLRLVRQMLVESVLLAMLGGVLSIPVAAWSADMLFRFLPQGHTPLTVDLNPDARALAFALAVSLLTGVLFGLIPALQATRGDLTATLKADSAAAIGDRRAGLRKLLVVAQVAFSIVLLIAAGVFIQTAAKLRPADYHVSADRVLLFTMKPQQEIYSPDRVRALTAELVRRVSELPGVTHAALAENGPLASRSSGGSVGTPVHDPVRAVFDFVTPGFFETIGVARIAGRDFTTADRQGSPPVVIVNQALARAQFPNQSPLGRTLVSPWDKTRVFEIVGVVADTHYYDVHGDAPPGVWFAIQQDTPYMPTLHVRTTSPNTGPDTAGMIAAVLREFDAIDRGFPVFNIRTLELRMEDALSRERMVAALSAAFRVLALALAAIGLYGIISYSVSRRTREIGIRMALGSSAGSVVWLTAREALALVAAGSVLGMGIAMALSRFLAQYWFGASPVGASSLLISAAAMLLIAAIAAGVPAARACRIDPLLALRNES